MVITCELHKIDVQMFGGGKLWRISHQKFLASKTLANFCLFALFILHIIK